jgi:hypothetical protein
MSIIQVLSFKTVVRCDFMECLNHSLKFRHPPPTLKKKT